MRTLENKKLNIQADILGFQGDKFIVTHQKDSRSYYKVLVDMLRRPPQDGWKTGPDMIKQFTVRCEVIDKLEAADKIDGPSLVNIEENEYDEILAAYKNWVWHITHKDILAFDKWLTGLEKVDALPKNITRPTH